MSVDETSELLAFAVSAKVGGARTHERIARLCNPYGSTPPMDSFGAETIDPACFRREFYSSLEETWRTLPKLVHYFRDLQAQDDVALRANTDPQKPVVLRAEKFIQDFDIAARGFSGARISTSDVEAYMGLAQYLESFFERFDQDGSGTISIDEALSGPDPAFPVYASTLKEATCRIGNCVEDENTLKGLFTYMLAHGSAPSKPQLVIWMVNPWKSFEADRGTLISILSSLSQATSSPSGTGH